MRKWRAAAKGFIVAVLGVMAFAAPQIAPAGGAKLRLATEAAAPPLNYIGKDGRLAGFDVDIGNALCKAMTVECKWVIEDWDNLVSGLNQRRYEAIVSSLPITGEQQKNVDFTNSYHVMPAAFLGAETLEVLKIDKTTLTDKIIGVEAGSVHEAFLRDNFADIAQIKPYDLIAQATLDLVGKRLDLVFGDRIELEYSFLKTKEGRGFKLVGPSYTDAKWFGAGAGIAVRKGDDALIERLNVALARIRADGTYKKINDRYFDFDMYGN
ncbi:hypothetical protein MNBD_ALPHA09-1267 [hydrothermal vent metagenome]|uniref:Solute-binding protein family 3/N-terminal domain-containing protein n=1 Tax=hydrothermal vent metagenome TaxID=652676 RepID=A0A3B0UGT4_9ZZZZ